MKNTLEDLRSKLLRIDGKGYKAYKDISGVYKDKALDIALDYIQGDPFASPSRIRVIIPLKSTGINPSSFKEKHCHIAIEDYLCRCVQKQLMKRKRQSKGSGKSGRITIDAPEQKVLQRTAIKVTDKTVEVRLEVGLPASGRRVLGKEAMKILTQQLPEIVNNSLNQRFINFDDLEEHVQLSSNQEFIRSYLNEKGAVAFIANGSILPRDSGISDKPMKKGAVPFTSPKSMETTLELPFGGIIKGMLIKEGITLIVGGGYHGKSTLLNAIEMGVYNHIPGDGRELCISRNDAMKIRSEDGRPVEKVDIHWFINNLPNGVTTEDFSTQNASGSTSQAANIIEAIQGNSSLLLIDEDTSATNFMIRDERMQQLVHSDKEPITPFIHRVTQLYKEKGISTVLVIGGSGDYFTVADQVIMLDAYQTSDRTKEAHQIGSYNPNAISNMNELNSLKSRELSTKSFSKREPRLKVKAINKETISYNRQDIDLRYLEQLVDPSQTRAMADILKRIHNTYKGNKDIIQAVDEILKDIDSNGLEAISSYKGHPGNLAMPRKLEVLAMLNRYHGLNIID